MDPYKASVLSTLARDFRYQYPPQGYLWRVLYGPDVAGDAVLRLPYRSLVEVGQIVPYAAPLADDQYNSLQEVMRVTGALEELRFADKPKTSPGLVPQTSPQSGTDLPQGGDVSVPIPQEEEPVIIMDQDEADEWRVIRYDIDGQQEEEEEEEEEEQEFDIDDIDEGEEGQASSFVSMSEGEQDQADFEFDDFEEEEEEEEEEDEETRLRPTNPGPNWWACRDALTGRPVPCIEPIEEDAGQLGALAATGLVAAQFYNDATNGAECPYRTAGIVYRFEPGAEPVLAYFWWTTTGDPTDPVGEWQTRVDQGYGADHDSVVEAKDVPYAVYGPYPREDLAVMAAEQGGACVAARRLLVSPQNLERVALRQIERHYGRGGGCRRPDFAAHRNMVTSRETGRQLDPTRLPVVGSTQVPAASLLRQDSVAYAEANPLDQVDLLYVATAWPRAFGLDRENIEPAVRSSLRQWSHLVGTVTGSRDGIAYPLYADTFYYTPDRRTDASEACSAVTIALYELPYVVGQQPRQDQDQGSARPNIKVSPLLVSQVVRLVKDRFEELSQGIRVGPAESAMEAEQENSGSFIEIDV
ncbi:hypothetical protein ml_423 [Mollivirus sibericum]|uniref:hypothetical protein n=1 Tax=Mollivirus sibericum TaxID=1678078 RepID=UPI0006B2DB91|nr:hypothetical protein ml_423 [Mollivirus sibericum]ALD62225.1 hypothetical protein ml_423 [Mollivirus sibericum]